MESILISVTTFLVMSWVAFFALQKNMREMLAAETKKCQDAALRVAQLEDAIRAHREFRGQKACWLNDHGLYALLSYELPLHSATPDTLLPKDRFLEFCSLYHSELTFEVHMVQRLKHIDDLEAKKLPANLLPPEIQNQLRKRTP